MAISKIDSPSMTGERTEMDKNDIKSSAGTAISTAMDKLGVKMRQMGATGNLDGYNDIYREGMNLLGPVIGLAMQGLLFDQLPEDDKDLVREIDRLRKGLIEIRGTIVHYLEHDKNMLNTLTELIGDGDAE